MPAAWSVSLVGGDPDRPWSVVTKPAYGGTAGDGATSGKWGGSHSPSWSLPRSAGHPALQGARCSDVPCPMVEAAKAVCSSCPVRGTCLPRVAGRILHARMRKGSANTARGAGRFVEELIARLRRAGAAGEIVLRVDSGFWSFDTIATLAGLDVRYTMAVRTGNKALVKVIAAIDDDAWADIDYTPDGQAQVAETTYKGRRLIVRRTRLTDSAQRRLWPDWRHHSSPTSTAPRQTSTPSTAATPRWSWPSAT